MISTRRDSMKLWTSSVAANSGRARKPGSAAISPIFFKPPVIASTSDCCMTPARPRARAWTAQACKSAKIKRGSNRELALNAAKCLSVSPVNRPPQRFIAVGSWWSVVGGWRVQATNHQPPTTNHLIRFSHHVILDQLDDQIRFGQQHTARGEDERLAR